MLSKQKCSRLFGVRDGPQLTTMRRGSHTVHCYCMIKEPGIGGHPAQQICRKDRTDPSQKRRKRKDYLYSPFCDAEGTKAQQTPASPAPDNILVLSAIRFGRQEARLKCGALRQDLAYGNSLQRA